MWAGPFFKQTVRPGGRKRAGSSMRNRRKIRPLQYGRSIGLFIESRFTASEKYFIRRTDSNA